MLFIRIALVSLFIVGPFLTQASHVSASETKVGQKVHKFQDRSRNRVLKTFVWYPTPTATKPTSFKKRGPFIPVRAVMDAPLANKSHPIVLLSHGSGGAATRLFWIAEVLVKNGYVVIAVNHMGNTTGDNSGDGLMRIWERPKDLTFALDQVLKTGFYTGKLNQDRVSAVGFSAGGTTSLMLAGAKLSHKKFTSPTPKCKGTKDPYFAKSCDQISKIDLSTYPQKIVESDYSDRRVKAAVAYDPGFAKSFEPKSLKRIAAKSYVFIAEKLFTPFEEIHSKDFEKLMGTTSTEITPKSIHMTFFQACKPGYSKNDPELRELCANNNVKVSVQRDVAKKTLAFLNKKMK